jgi:hypothetical protein
MMDLHSARGACIFLRLEGYRYEAHLMQDLADEVKRLTDGIAKERAAVVAWLREGAGQTDVTQHESYGHAFAYGIERGEHRHEEEP